MIIIKMDQMILMIQKTIKALWKNYKNYIKKQWTMYIFLEKGLFTIVLISNLLLHLLFLLLLSIED
jgi:hypothetical protein